MLSLERLGFLGGTQLKETGSVSVLRRTCGEAPSHFSPLERANLQSYGKFPLEGKEIQLPIHCVLFGIGLKFRHPVIIFYLY
jgi:hypothetical protein